MVRFTNPHGVVKVTRVNVGDRLKHFVLML